MNPVKLAILTIFHPLDGFPMIRSDRENFSLIPPTIITILFFVVRIVSIYVMHYPIASADPHQVNLAMEVFVLLLPMASWVVVHHAITTISDGECKTMEVFAGLAYSLVPYVLFTLPIALFSNLYSATSAGTISFLQLVVLVWTGFQIVVSIKAMNDYTVAKTIGIILITIIGILLCWVLILIFYALTGQLIDFAITLVKEFVMIYIG